MWVPTWEDVGYFVHNRIFRFVGGTSKDLSSPLPYGTFTRYNSTFTSFPNVAMNKLASALSGMMWKNGARTFQLKRSRWVPDNANTKAFYDKLNQITISAMEHPHARLLTSLNEDMREQVSFGTSGVGVFRSGDPAAPLVYKSFSIRNCTCIEDETGRINGVYIEECISRYKAWKRYGDVALPDNRPTNYNVMADTEEVVVCQVIKPNPNAIPGSLAANNLPYMSLHYEIKSGKILRDSGYEEMPIKFSRFEKNTEETYARCPGINALASIRELNEAVRQMKLGTELDNNVPYALLDDGAFGGGVIDRTPGGFTVLDVSGRISGNPIVPLHQPVSRQPMQMTIDMLREDISMSFYLDQVLDLNNTQRQTLGEANIRNEIRSEPLAGIMIRQLEEKAVPLIETSVNLLYSEGAYGVVKGSDKHKQLLSIGIEPELIPDEIAQVMADGKDFYDIVFVSPASRMMRAEELRGVTNAVSLAAQLAQVDGGKMLRRYDTMAIGALNDELNGVPDRVVKSADQYQEEEAALAEQQSIMMQQEAVAKEAEINKQNAAAEQSRAQAQASLSGGNGQFGALGGMTKAANMGMM